VASNDNSDRRIGLLIEPLDVLLFRDARPFEIGSRAYGGLPMPQSLSGAIRTFLWRSFKPDLDLGGKAILERYGGDPAAAAESLGIPSWAARVAVTGPWLYVKPGGELAKRGEYPVAPGPVAPAPADLVCHKDKSGSLDRLRPLSADRELPGWIAPVVSEDALRPLWRSGRQAVEKAKGWLDRNELEIYLSGGIPNRVAPDDLFFCWEHRTGIAVDPGRMTAEDKKLFSVRFLRLKNGAAFYAEVVLGDGAPADEAGRFDNVLLPWGGEGRRCRISRIRPVEWPPAQAPGDGTLLLLISPGIFLHRAVWRPDRAGLPPLVAAAVPGFAAVSGWDLARREPKPTRFAAAAGSVYLFAQEASRDSNSKPFACLSSDVELSRLGYGIALKGSWTWAKPACSSSTP
jgi:CRISPR-associated protein Cmr3